MSTLKTHNLQSPDSGSANIALAPNAGMVVAGVSTFNSGVGIGDSIFHLGDDNTQIRFPSADTITAETGNSERLRISSNGDVRVGGGAPVTFGSGTTVHETYNSSTYVANLVTSGTHQLQMIASQTHGVTSIGTRSNHNLNLCANDSTKMTITSNGSVGIGTDTPVATSKLDVTDGIISVGAAVTTIDTRIQFERKTTGALGWIGIPNWDADGLYIYGPTSNSNEIAARYTSGAWGFFTGGVDATPRLNIDSSGNISLPVDNQQLRLGASGDLILMHENNHSYVQAYNEGNMYLGCIHNGDVIIRQNSQNRYQFAAGGFYPMTNNAYDLGSSSVRWRNVYTTDLQLSNKGKTNDVDNTWGDYTIQEGESDLFLINNRNGKKYMFLLKEVS